MATRIASDPEGIAHCRTAPGAALAGVHGGMGDAPADQLTVGGPWMARPGAVIDWRIGQHLLHVDPGNEVLATTAVPGDHDPETVELARPEARETPRHGPVRAATTPRTRNPR